MKIYHYHPDTGVFLGEGIADPSPLEQDVWLIPASATTIEPPQAPAGSQAVFGGGAWRLQAVPEPEPEAEPVPIAKPAPIPEPVPELTPAEKLAAAGLSVDDLKELLGL